MASEYIGYNRGADLSPMQATVGTSTGSTDVELRIDLTKSLTREDIILITEAIERYVLDQRITFMGL